MVFDKDTMWARKPIPYTNDYIKELDDAIVHIEIFESKALEMEDIQLVENFEVNKTIPTITRQADYEQEDLDMNLEESK